MYLCCFKQEDVITMVQVIRPELLILCELGEGEKLEIFSWLCANASNCPVLGVATEQEWRQCRKNYRSGQFHLLIRPVSKQKLRETCHEFMRSAWQNPGSRH